MLQRSASEAVAPLLWQCVTGRIKSGEQAAQAALREVQEECGVKPEEFWVLPTISQFYSASDDTINTLPVFGVVLRSGSPITLSHEHQDYRWCSMEQACDLLLIPAQQRATEVFEDLLLHRANDPAFRQMYSIEIG